MRDATAVTPGLTRWVMALVIGALLPAGAGAGDVGDFVFKVNVPPNMVDRTLYGGKVKATITTPDGEPTGDWSGPNILTGTLTGRRGDSLSFTGTSNEFEPFVRQNADEIIRILFPSDPEGSVQGVPGGPAVALFTFDALVTSPVSPSEFAALRGERMRRFAPIDGPPTSQVLALVEGESFTVDGTSGANYKLTPGLGFNIGKLQLGVLAPLKYGDLDDSIHTNSYSAGLNLSAKYDFDLAPRWVLSPLAGGFANVFVFTSDDLEAFGYIRYGGYVGVATRAALGPVFVAGGLLYTVSTLAIPGGLVPSEVDPLVGALTDRPVDQQITLGAKVGVLLGQLGVPALNDVVANLGAAHIETVGPSAIESGKRSFTQGQVSLMYTRGAPMSTTFPRNRASASSEAPRTSV